MHNDYASYEHNQYDISQSIKGNIYIISEIEPQIKDNHASSIIVSYINNEKFNIHTFCITKNMESNEMVMINKDCDVQECEPIEDIEELLSKKQDLIFICVLEK